MLSLFSRVFISPPSFFLLERPASPFIGEGEDTCYREKEKSEGEEGLQGRRVLLLLYVGPADAVDGDGDGSTSGSCSPLMP